MSGIEPGAVELYRVLLRGRLRESTCGSCGASLEEAVVERTGGGAAHDDLQLTDASIARVLASTVSLSVQCGHCGAREKVGADAARPPIPAVELPLPEPAWAPGAEAVYKSVIRDRLKTAHCGNCGLSLEDAELLEAVGGTTVQDYGLSDESLARMIAATQHMVVRCGRCGERATVCESCRTTG